MGLLGKPECRVDAPHRAIGADFRPENDTAALVGRRWLKQAEGLSLWINGSEANPELGRE